jgi:integral membrane protein
VKGALTFYRVMAYIAGVVLVLFCGVLIAKYGFDQRTDTDQRNIAIVATAHGYIYMVYLAASINLAFRAKWGLVRTVLTCIAGTIPFLSFVAEHYDTLQVRALMASEAAATATPTA